MIQKKLVGPKLHTVSTSSKLVFRFRVIFFHFWLHPSFPVFRCQRGVVLHIDMVDFYSAFLTIMPFYKFIGERLSLYSKRVDVKSAAFVISHPHLCEERPPFDSGIQEKM